MSIPAVIAGLVVAVIALAPLPLGSNRPLFWLLWAALLGLLGLAYGIAALFGMTPPLRLPLPETLILAAITAWLGLQLLLPGAPLTLSDGTTVTSPHLTLDPGSTLLSLLVLATYAVLFLLASLAASDPALARRMLVAIFAITIAYAIYGLATIGADKPFYRGYATASFVNRNAFATFLAAGAAIGAALLAARPCWPHLALTGIGLAFVLAALFATGSRAGLLAGLAGIAVVLLFTVRISLRLTLLALIAALAILFGAGLADRLLLAGAEGRPALYAQVWQAILARPVTGYGGGSFAAVFPAFQHAPLDGGFVWDHAHSSYLTAWFELGLIAGSLPLLLLALLVRRSWVALSDPARRTAAIAALAVATVFALHALVDFSAEIMADAMLLLAVLALPAGPLRRSAHAG
jgi:O-antigen ligase